MTHADNTHISLSLLKWFEKEKRPLPWRKNYKPYEVWVSEIMLQQTQMETVLPYYERWLKKFSDIPSLARAPQESVLKLWEGLGYYSRARNIHKSARYIMTHHNGEFPSNVNEISKLKGVGRYTAGAIYSIAFNQKAAIVDGNILRVLSRIFKIEKPIDDLKHRDYFWTLQESLIPEHNPRDFNQSLMELGALVCKKEKPLCAQCPVKSLCKAYQQNRVDQYPIKSKKTKIIKVNSISVFIRYQNRFYIHRKPEGGVMGGLWQLPEWKVLVFEEKKLKQILNKKLKNILKIKNASGQYLGSIKRNYTYYQEKMYVFLVDTDRSNIQDHWQSKWIDIKQIKNYPFSAGYVKAWGLLKKKNLIPDLATTLTKTK